jgi:hypothetical protein
MTSRPDACPGIRPSQAVETSIASLVVVQEIFCWLNGSQWRSRMPHDVERQALLKTIQTRIHRAMITRRREILLLMLVRSSAATDISVEEVAMT